MPPDNEDFLADIDRFLDELDDVDGLDTAADPDVAAEVPRHWLDNRTEFTYGPLVSTSGKPPSEATLPHIDRDEVAAADDPFGGEIWPGSGEKQVDVDPDELPDLTPPGYRRDGRGSWRRDDGTKVPGARDLTLRRLYGEPGEGPMRLPAGLVRSRKELAWGEGWVVPGDPVVEIPAPAWNAMADVCIGIDAPELNVVVMVDTDELATIAGGLSLATLRSHLARSTAPPPFRRQGSLWPPLVAGWWAARRRSAGRPSSRSLSRRAS